MAEAEKSFQEDFLPGGVAAEYGLMGWREVGAEMLLPCKASPSSGIPALQHSKSWAAAVLLSRHAHPVWASSMGTQHGRQGAVATVRGQSPPSTSAAEAATLSCQRSQSETFVQEIPSSKQPLHIHRLQAVRAVHYPEALEHAEAGRRRLAFDELFLLQLKLLLKRALQRCAAESAVPQAVCESFIAFGMWPWRCHGAGIPKSCMPRRNQSLCPSTDAITARLTGPALRAA